MECSMNTQLFRNSFILFWSISKKWSVYNMEQSTRKLNENSYETFILKFELNLEVWVHSEYWSVSNASRRWLQASQVSITFCPTIAFFRNNSEKFDK